MYPHLQIILVLKKQINYLGQNIVTLFIWHQTNNIQNDDNYYKEINAKRRAL